MFNRRLLALSRVVPCCACALVTLGAACAIKEESASVVQARSQDSHKTSVLDPQGAAAQVYECAPDSKGQYADKVCQEIALSFEGHLQKDQGFQIACAGISSLDHMVIVRDNEGWKARYDGLDRASARKLASDIGKMFPECSGAVVRQARPI